MACRLNSHPKSKKRRQTTQCVTCLLFVVEMPGIEPGSEEFDHEYTTSLVTLCVLAQMRPE